MESRTAAPIVLVDRVAVLADLYAVADAAFVGGGFHNAGLHSVLEPASFGVPVAFGPKHGSSRTPHCCWRRTPAPQSPIDGVGVALTEWLGEETVGRRMGDAARSVVEHGLGAGARSAELIRPLL